LDPRPEQQQGDDGQDQERGADRHEYERLHPARVDGQRRWLLWHTRFPWAAGSRASASSSRQAAERPELSKALFPFSFILFYFSRALSTASAPTSGAWQVKLRQM